MNAPLTLDETYRAIIYLLLSIVCEPQFPPRLQRKCHTLDVEGCHRRLVTITKGYMRIRPLVAPHSCDSNAYLQLLRHFEADPDYEMGDFHVEMEHSVVIRCLIHYLEELKLAHIEPSEMVDLWVLLCKFHLFAIGDLLYCPQCTQAIEMGLFQPRSPSPIHRLERTFIPVQLTPPLSPPTIVRWPKIRRVVSHENCS